MPADTDTPTHPHDLAMPRERVVVPLRLGRDVATAGRHVHMPKGLLGFPDHHDFVLANVPDLVLAQFKLLRSLDDRGPVLIVTPMPENRRLIADEDLAEIADTAGTAPDDAIFLLVVAVRPRPDGEGMAMSLNLRAPIVFDPANRLARQCVIRNARYRVRYPFFGWSRVRDTGHGR